MNFKSIISYFKQLTSKTSDQSSKRFLALYLGIIVVSILVFVYTDKNNFLMVLAELLGFISLMVGASVWEKKKKKKDEEF